MAKVNVGKSGFARLQFAEWLRENHPQIFQAAIAAASGNSGVAASGLNGLGLDFGGVIEKATTTAQSFWEKFSDAAVGLGTTYLTLKNQRDMMKLNQERATQGLPPIDPSTSAPVLKTQVDLDPRLAQQLVSNAGSSATRMTLIIGAVALAAVFMLKK